MLYNIKDKQGKLITEEDKVMAMWRQYFQELYGEDNTITNEDRIKYSRKIQRNLLRKVITLEELRYSKQGKAMMMIITVLQQTNVKQRLTKPWKQWKALSTR